MSESTVATIPVKQSSIAGKLFYTLFMLILTLAITAFVFVLFFKMKTLSVLGIGIALQLLYAILAFTVKKGFRSWVIWWGILSLITAGLWGYLVVTS